MTEETVWSSVERKNTPNTEERLSKIESTENRQVENRTETKSTGIMAEFSKTNGKKKSTGSRNPTNPENK